jgi:hypothetical protein
MIHQLYSPRGRNIGVKPRTVSERIPSAVILDTDALLEKLRKDIVFLTENCVPEDKILESVFEALQFDRNVEMELSLSAQFMLYNFLGEKLTDYERSFGSSIIDFGLALHQQLKQIRAYRNGYLFYHFCQLLGRDVVITHLEPLEEIHYAGEPPFSPRITL